MPPRACLHGAAYADPLLSTGKEQNAATGTLAAANYSFVFVNGTLTVNMATPTITWATPAAIPYGTPLSATQLDATMNAPGTCYYTPDTGIVLEVGTQTLAVDCMPNDTVDYNIPAEQTVSLTVSQSTPSIWISNLPASAGYGQNFGVAYSYSGDGTTSVVSNTTSICTVSGDVVSFVGLGTCSLTASATGTTNYLAVTGSAQTFTVTKDPPAIWINNLPTNAVHPGSFTATYDYSGNGTTSLTSSTTSVCTVSGNTVTYVGDGTCTLTPSATATTDYAASTGDSQSFTIGQTALQPATIYTYTVPTGGFDAVGNIVASQDSIMGNWTYQYDVLNRLTSGAASTGTYASQNACWSYDDFGNRTIESVQTGACSTAGTFASTMVFNAANQLSGVIAPGGSSQSPPSLLYDSAGDVTSDSSTGNQYVYDAEGRICAFQTPSGLGGTIMMGYLYNADGIRVAKGTITTMTCDPATNGFTMTGNNTGTYVLGQGGEELTQLSGSGAWQRTNVFGGGKQLATYDSMGLHFQIEDALGTRRMQTNADGQPETDIQSLPYGDKLATATDQYAPATADDATPLHFTGKERDTESGNDYFGARYYGSSMGRFLSPDWSVQIEPVPYARLDNPQTLNLYAYLRNNPLAGVDADGHCAKADEAVCAQITKDMANGADSSAELSGVHKAMHPQQQSAPAPAGSDPTKRLNFSGVPVTVDYSYGPMPNSPYEGGVDITATPSGCNGCQWSQVYQRTGTGATPPTKDGPGVGPLYGQEGGPANQFKDRPASGNGSVGTFTGVAILGNTNIQNKTFGAIGAMTYSYSVNGNGGVAMPITPRLATASEMRMAISVLQANSPDWQIH